ncbi:MAG TPA: energy-coupling factor ABC transporter ATP-binding protein [Pseudogracilibacillus sp.]|nr:energy-coupling factor ABC transporter ATP-binding protein [Pseudogracilibacillus sp.]
MDKLIEFNHVSFRYDEDGPWVLKDCSFEIDAGETVAIIGHNGSGKSTIAKLMNGLLFPQEGEIKINGTLLNDETVWDIRQDIGMVFQNPDNQFVGSTVQDDVAFGMENRGIERSVMKKRITSTLRSVNMLEYRFAEPHRLSGGQKQRVAIAGVLAIQPQVMILDEATVMLDPIGRIEIMETMTELQQKESLSFITITHDLNEVKLVDKVIVMNEGNVWEINTPKEILKEGNKLKEIGLAVPFISSLADALKEQDIALENNPLTMDEMLEELWISHSNK